MAAHAVALLCGIEPGTKCEAICRVDKEGAGDVGRKPVTHMTKLHPPAVQLCGYTMILLPTATPAAS